MVGKSENPWKHKAHTDNNTQTNKLTNAQKHKNAENGPARNYKEHDSSLRVRTKRLPFVFSLVALATQNWILCTANCLVFPSLVRKAHTQRSQGKGKQSALVPSFVETPFGRVHDGIGHFPESRAAD